MELLKNLEGMTADEQMTAVLELQKSAMAHLEEQRQISIGKSAELVIQGLKRIKSDFEGKFDSLNYDIQSKVASLKNGEDGKDGLAGKDGPAGRDGLPGRDGKDGKDGQDGQDGQDGVSVVDARIDFDGSLVITLSTGREMNVGEVVAPDLAEKIKLVTSGGGTSQQVLDTLVDLQDQINVLTGIDGTLGTMAQQDANAVAITGGTINGATVGATTPAAGTFTTLGAQNATLRGTGQNLVTQSQTFTNAAWSKVGSTITAASIIAPDGNLTGQTLNEDTSTGQHAINRGGGSETLVVGATYTLSVFAKQAGRSVIFIQSLITFAKSYFDIASGTVLSSGSGMTSTITSVGNGWYRCAVTFVCDSTNNSIRVIAATTGNGVQTYTGTNIASIYLWGAQLELGSIANTYIPTTTTAVYGAPTLSFSGVAGSGLQSDGSLYLQPAGTGAVQAQATTSTATGGNARGANAVDWQTERGSAGQVASGSYATISGGRRGTASAGGATVGGGWTNTASGTESVISGGSTNTTSGQWSFIGGGANNTCAGFYNVINGGFTNSGTSGSTVTTQATTTVTSGSTAVTLSGSNGNIRVGQLVAGTGIAFPSYVSAISGTSLTLSVAASGSGTPTLSFFTPHGVVVGGGNNQATGSYSFIGGGGDAGTAANRNVASGAWSFVGGGMRNTASGLGSVVVGGGDGTATYANTASGTGSFVGAGINNSSTGTYSTVVNGALSSSSGQYGFVGGGYSNVASGGFSTIAGGAFGTTRGITGNTVSSACFLPIAFAQGVSQSAVLVLGRQTTDATPTVITSDNNAAGTTNQVILPNNSAYYFRGTVIANVTGGGNTKSWTIEGAIKRGANAASTTLVGVTVMSPFADVGAATWTIAAAADTTNGGLQITFTGQASTTIRCVCKLETTEVTF